MASAWDIGQIARTGSQGKRVRHEEAMATIAVADVTGRVDAIMNDRQNHE